MLLDEVLPLFEPRPRQSTQAWCRERIQTDAGRPYDADAYPHLGAPGGPFDAFDDPDIRIIWMQWATRLGKTFFGQACQIAVSDIDPAPMMFCTADKKLALEVVERTYRMMRRTAPGLSLKGVDDQKGLTLSLGQAEWFVAWATSIVTLADKEVKIGHGSEISKYVHYTTATEADPLRLLLNRGKNFPMRKFILESTPTIRGKCRVERGRLRSDNRQYWVPCPHCGHYQRLAFNRNAEALTPDPSPARGEGRHGTGLVWEKLESGRSDPDLAFRTARYVCEDCRKPIKDHHRGPMMRGGVWVPEGCGVDPKKARAAADARRKDPESRLPYLTGTPVRQGNEAGFQLSSLYALSLRWGDIAKEFCSVKDKPAELQDFVNSWLGETWERIAARQTWEELGKRIIVPVGPGRVPMWAVRLTAGVDKQAEHYVWALCGWGPERQGHVVAYGQTDTLEEFETEVLAVTWPYEDTGELALRCTLIDSGFRPRDVGAFCRAQQRKGRAVFPSKGASQPLDSPYAKRKQGPDKALPGLTLIFVDTRSTQDWIDHALHTLTPADPDSLSLYHGALADHQDLLEQLLNDHPVTRIDTHNQAVETWDRVDETIPNDYRDAVRNARVAFLLDTRGAPLRPRGFPVKTAAQLGEGRKRFTMPDGRPYLVTER